LRAIRQGSMSIFTFSSTLSSAVRVKMDAYEVELHRDLHRQKSGEVFPIARPRQQSHRDQTVTVVEADRRRHSLNPLHGDVFPSASGGIEGDVLEEIVTAEKAARRPFARLAALSGRNRLVNEVVTRRQANSWFRAIRCRSAICGIAGALPPAERSPMIEATGRSLQCVSLCRG
jgi:hypothetical protein